MKPQNFNTTKKKKNLMWKFPYLQYHQTIIYGYVVIYTHIHTILTHHMCPCTHTHMHTHKHTIAHTDFSSGDYKSVSMTLGPFTSQQPRQCFTVSITNDTFIELNETFNATLTLASVTTITADRIIIDPPETTVQIADNDLSKLIIVKSAMHVSSPDGL